MADVADVLNTSATVSRCESSEYVCVARVAVKNLEYINVDVFEILPPFGRLNDTEGEITISLTSNVR